MGIYVVPIWATLCTDIEVLGPHPPGPLYTNQEDTKSAFH